MFDAASVYVRVTLSAARSSRIKFLHFDARARSTVSSSGTNYFKSENLIEIPAWLIARSLRACWVSSLRGF